MARPALTKLPPFTLLDEPDISFSPSDATHVDIHPLRGLVNFGPYSKGSFGGYTSRVRIATVGPESAFHRRGDLMRLLRDVHRPSDRSEYVPEYPGFDRLFRVALESAPASAHIKWPEHLDQLPGDGDAQHRLYLAMEAALLCHQEAPSFAHSQYRNGRMARQQSSFLRVKEWQVHLWPPISAVSQMNVRQVPGSEI